MHLTENLRKYFPPKKLQKVKYVFVKNDSIKDFQRTLERFQATYTRSMAIFLWITSQNGEFSRGLKCQNTDPYRKPKGFLTKEVAKYSKFICSENYYITEVDKLQIKGKKHYPGNCSNSLLDFLQNGIVCGITLK